MESEVSTLDNHACLISKKTCIQPRPQLITLRSKNAYNKKPNMLKKLLKVDAHKVCGPIVGNVPKLSTLMTILSSRLEIKTKHELCPY